VTSSCNPGVEKW
jgi:hypothetical protein